MTLSYKPAEYHHFLEHGGRMLPDPEYWFSKNVHHYEWRIVPWLPFHDGADMRLQMRQPEPRIEKVHLTLILRGVAMVRLDTNDGHRTPTGVRVGHHINWRPDSNSRGATSFDLIPPLDFPQSFQAGETARYWKVLEWFCETCRIDTSQVVLSDLEAVK